MDPECNLEHQIVWTQLYHTGKSHGTCCIKISSIWQQSGCLKCQSHARVWANKPWNKTWSINHATSWMSIINWYPAVEKPALILFGKSIVIRHFINLSLVGVMKAKHYLPWITIQNNFSTNGKEWRGSWKFVSNFFITATTKLKKNTQLKSIGGKSGVVYNNSYLNGTPLTTAAANKVAYLLVCQCQDVGNKYKSWYCKVNPSWRHLCQRLVSVFQEIGRAGWFLICTS